MMQKTFYVIALALGSFRTFSQIKINEFMTGGKENAKEEFVELYNASNTSVNLKKWKILYKSSAGKNETELLTFNEDLILQPGEYFVAASEDFPGKKNGKLNDNLSGTAGAIGLRNDTNALVESVAYGKVSLENNFIEKTPCAAPTKGTSMSRVPDGTDTDDNSSDFIKTKVITAGENNNSIISSTLETDDSNEIDFGLSNEHIVTIKFKTPSVYNEVVIFDNMGRQVFQKNESTVDLNISSYEAGMYLIHIISENKKLVKKVIIK